MSTVAEVAAETGRPAGDVLAACHDLGIVATSAASGLSRHEHERLRTALGASPHLPPVAAGSMRPEPGAAPGADERTLLERHAELRATARTRRIDARRVSRYAVYGFFVIAVAVSVVGLRDSGDDPTCVDIGAGAQLTTADCADPHDAELVGEIVLPGAAGAPFPGADALAAEAAAACAVPFTEVVGVAPAESELDLVLLAPTPAGWRSGDRTVRCLAEDPRERLTGPVGERG